MSCADLASLIERCLAWQQARGYAPSTLRNWRANLTRFASWCAERDVLTVQAVTRDLVERYQRSLYRYRRPNGARLSLASQHGHLVVVRSFFAWLVRRGELALSPAAALELPRLGRRLPRSVLSIAQVAQVLALPDVRTPVGLRDRAMMEVLYSTGLRRLELVRLRLYDLDSQTRTVFVREGKGRRDRVVPIGARATLWVETYLDKSRPMLAESAAEKALFVSIRGGALSADHLSDTVRRYVRAAGVAEQGSCHLFRHAMATQMLDGGADIRHVQAMLGHATLSTTQVYTQVSVRKLQEVHARTHPTACAERARG